MVRKACAAHLRRTAALAPGADHLAPRRVDDAEDRRSGQEEPLARRIGSAVVYRRKSRVRAGRRGNDTPRHA